MKKISLVILSVFILTVTACKEEKKQVMETSQMKEVMAIHDEVMPKMSELGKLVSQLKPMADSLGMESAPAKAILDLQNANKSMMDWMQGFGNKFDSEEIMKGKALSKEKVELLKEEEEKINKVKEQINTSIENAQNLLKTY